MAQRGMARHGDYALLEGRGTGDAMQIREDYAARKSSVDDTISIL